MRRLAIFAVCLIAGWLAGYLIGGRGEPPPKAPSPPEDTSSIASLLDERDLLQARIEERSERRREIDAGATGKDGSRALVRQIGKSVSVDSASVRLVVTGHRGKPLSGQRIWLSSYETAFRQESKTDVEGTAEFEGIPAGVLHVNVEFEETGFRRSIKTDIANGFLTEISVPAPEGSATVSGVVRDKRAGPLAEVRVALRIEAGDCTDFTGTETDDLGRFELRNVPAGSCRLWAHGSQIERDRHTAVEFAVPAEGTVSKDIVLGTESLFGIVTDSGSGAPLPGVVVRVADQNRNHRRTTTDDAGTYRLPDLRPGRWDLETILPGYVRHHRNGNEVRAGEESRLDLAMDPAVEAIIVILDPDGRPITGRVGVNFRPPDSKLMPRWNHSGLATESGEVRYRELPPGEYEVRAFAGGLTGSVRHRFVLGKEERVEVRLRKR